MTCVIQGLIVTRELQVQLRYMHALCLHANDIQWGQKRALFCDSVTVCMLLHSSLLDLYIEHQTLAAFDQAKSPNSSCMTAYCICHNTYDPGISSGSANQCILGDMYPIRSHEIQSIKEKVQACFGMRVLQDCMRISY